ncbi:MAG: hypothetical protein J6C64_03585 [Lachnospiraceae bacterium]|nr:hypothetical protein [Lachnospiraceae bacterium]
MKKVVSGYQLREDILPGRVNRRIVIKEGRRGAAPDTGLSVAGSPKRQS